MRRTLPLSQEIGSSTGPTSARTVIALQLPMALPFFAAAAASSLGIATANVSVTTGKTTNSDAMLSSRSILPLLCHLICAFR
jgi:hypothetical protein